MVLIQKLEEAIEDEIHDVKHYAKWAAELKKDYPALAQVLYTILNPMTTAQRLSGPL